MSTQVTLTWPTELPEQFDREFLQGMLDRMALSSLKYGRVTVDGTRKRDMWQTIELRWQTYRDTDNPEFLMDVANFAMIEFMVALMEGKVVKATDSDESPGLVLRDGSLSHAHVRDLE